MKRYQRAHITVSQTVGRRGVITPLAAMVLLVVLAGIALVVNRLWLDAASLEVTTCIETAVLAAGQELAADDLLKEKPNYQTLMERAEKAANRAIILNTVAGHRIGIPLIKDENLFFGKSIPVADTGIKRFLQTDHQPMSIQLKTHQISRLNNPVADFVSEFTSTNSGTTGAQIEATIDNHIIGVRPFANVSVPAFPLAILKNDPSGKHTETWELQIDQKKGKDEYRYNADTKTVTRGSDGIPEILLTGKPRRGNISDANLQVLDFGSLHNSESVERQILSGLTKQDLKHYHGELSFNAGPIQVNCSPALEDNEQDAFQKMTGQCRICFLYDKVESSSRSHTGLADCTNMVAGRIMSIKRLENQTCEIILQPGVMTTRTGILAKGKPPETDSQSASNSKTKTDNDQQRKNKYIYKLYLTQ
ncbi:MAG: hypothetical protein K0U86_05370 [Planctomycetes bacterium]|nr:hypothetical protein [Planctomycetota bacterium]MCH9724318.1 hypothetical protein [Planctomycetota bacterium]MCH9777337.1 hypothetical protein [Planctomycetota bacterium]MCH9792769.1 hypothetical protein [Planctomycetota bacterium]MDF1742183.1 hypothetical protein [Gimesia sp.]